MLIKILHIVHVDVLNTGPHAAMNPVYCSNGSCKDASSGFRVAEINTLFVKSYSSRATQKLTENYEEK